jgi:hypothetical protein
MAFVLQHFLEFLHGCGFTTGSPPVQAFDLSGRRIRDKRDGKNRNDDDPFDISQHPNTSF